MTSSRLSACALFALFLPAALVTGCSLVNSFDDVVPLAQGDDGGPVVDSSLSADTGGKSDASTDSGTNADSTIATDSGVDSGASGQDSGTDTGPADAGPPTGIIVVAASQLSGDGGFVLTTLNPFNGSELGTRQRTTVFSVKYDGDRDLWYVFDDPANPTGFATRNEVVTLHVRSLDTHSGEWTELGSVAVPAIQSNDNVAVLNNRLAYVAYVPTPDAGTSGGSDGGRDASDASDDATSDAAGLDDGAVNDGAVNAGFDAAPPPSGLELVLIDTTVPASPVIDNPPTTIPNISGLIGSRGTGVGGNVNLFYPDTASCTGPAGSQVCPLDVMHILVTSGGVSPPVDGQLSVEIARTGRPSLGSYIKSGPEDLVAVPAEPGAADASATLYPLSPTNHSLVGGTTAVPVQSSLLSLMAVSECESEAFLAGLPSDTRVYAAPILPTSPALSFVDLGRAAQSFYFEPYTSTLIAPFDDFTTGTIDAYRYALSPSGTGWALSNRSGTDWSPPTDLDPKVIAVREPIPFPASDLCTP